MMDDCVLKETAATGFYTLSLHDALPIWRKMLLEAGLLDSPLATVRLNWRRLRSLAAPPVHYLPGVPVEEAEDFPPQA